MLTFYTEEEIREMLSLGEKQTRALMRTEGFPSIKIGKVYRVEQAAFEHWLATTKEISPDYRGVSTAAGDKHATK
ncbi:MAG: helix-turn-helix domain-containing protein [Saccharofermentanaceae bacterium]|nr:helix-turn-helix domain-containing protein [Saccharofermentanaceae bacterium]